MQLKIQFQSTKKETLSITSYFSKLKNIADSLTMARFPISDEDFIMQLLARLPLDYDVVVDQVNSSRTAMTPEEVQCGGCSSKF